MPWRVLRRNKLYLLLHTPWKCHFKAEVFGAHSAFSFPGVCLRASLVQLCPLAGSASLKTSRRQITDTALLVCSTIWTLFGFGFFLTAFSLMPWCYMTGWVTDWSFSSYVLLNTTITESLQIDLSVRFTSFLVFSKSIKNARFIFQPLRKGKKPKNHRNVSSSPVLPLVRPWDLSMRELADSGSVPSFPGGYLNPFFQGTTSIKKILNSLRQNFA